ncbi:MAG TPA: MFS transporter [Actinomycetota bacterium]|nr:MFS transporter [Actinomycetota bacterium]
MTKTALRTRRPLLAIFGANAVSLTGNVAALVAIPWFVLETTNSASKTGITAAAALLPVVLSGLFGGAMVDRLGYRRTSVLSDLASAGAVAAIPLLHSTMGLEFWQLLVLVFLGGLLDAPGGTARTALLPEAAQRAGWTFERATGMTAVVERGSRLAGAPLAALLIGVVGPTNVLWIDAASFVVSAAMIAAGVPRPTSTVDRGASSYLQELREGYRFLRRDRTLGTLVFMVSVTNAFDAVTMVALPVLAHRVYGSATSLGLMIAVGGAGAVVGALAFAVVGERRSRRALFTWGFIVITVSYPVAAVFPPLWILLVAKAISGLASGPINPVIDTVYLERVPAGVRGRVFGVTHAAAWIAIPLGVLLGGSIIDLIGLRATFLVTGAAYLAVTVTARFSDALRGLDRRVPDEPLAETAPAA